MKASQSITCVTFVKKMTVLGFACYRVGSVKNSMTYINVKYDVSSELCVYIHGAIQNDRVYDSIGS